MPARGVRAQSSSSVSFVSWRVVMGTSVGLEGLAPSALLSSFYSFLAS